MEVLAQAGAPGWSLLLFKEKIEGESREAVSTGIVINGDFID